MYKHQVRRFYESIWNSYDMTSIPQLLHENFCFRGSLGIRKSGYKEFGEYIKLIHDALGKYQCTIEELVAEDDKVFAKMLFTGIHKGCFLGFSPTGKALTWHGCALFSFLDTKISDLWVLGDLAGLEIQLKENAMIHFFEEN